jgi:hypothetical protein
VVAEQVLFARCAEVRVPVRWSLSDQAHHGSARSREWGPAHPTARAPRNVGKDAATELDQVVGTSEVLAPLVIVGRELRICHGAHLIRDSVRRNGCVGASEETATTVGLRTAMPIPLVQTFTWTIRVGRPVVRRRPADPAAPA